MRYLNRMWIGGMRLSRYRPLFTISPLKLVGAVATTLVILITINIGGSSRDVGLAVGLSFLGNLIGVLIWPNIMGKKGNYVGGIISGYLLLSISVALLATETLLNILISSFLITFFTNLIYFSLLYFLVDNYTENIDEMVGSMESIGGWSWVAGLLFGFYASNTLPLRILISILTAILIIAVVISIILLVTGIKERIKTMVDEEEGVLPLLDRGLEKVIDFEERIPSILFSGIHVIFGGSLFYSPVYLKVKGIGRDRIMLYLGITLIFISFGNVYTQLIKHIKDIGYPDSTIYFLALLSSVLSALTYLVAGDKSNPLKKFVRAGSIRVSAFITLTLLTLVAYPLQIIVLAIFYILSGFTWAYLIVNLNLYALKHGKSEIGFTNFFGNIGLLTGAVSSGLIIQLIGFELLYIISALLLSIGLLITYYSNK
ncbi:MAG TPA: MFS transporter [Thermoprotei archaeon]|nr:MFS transporter [Thermoprotei archaeon]